jgi:hypothetical protein
MVRGVWLNNTRKQCVCGQVCVWVLALLQQDEHILFEIKRCTLGTGNTTWFQYMSSSNSPTEAHAAHLISTGALPHSQHLAILDHLQNTHPHKQIEHYMSKLGWVSSPMLCQLHHAAPNN